MAAVTLLAAAMVGAFLFLDGRLDSIEKQLTSDAVRNYQPPDWEAYSAPEAAYESLPVRRLVYAPVYSHIYYEGGAPFSLETTLSIRNVSVSESIYLRSVEYYDTAGKHVKSYLPHTITLSPLQTIEFLVERRDASGGSGANFLVAWGGPDDADAPLIETVMVGVAGAYGVCFSRTGVELSSDSPNPAP